jgi:hypothetical protein
MKNNYAIIPHKKILLVEIPIIMNDKLKEIAIKHNQSISQIITELIESAIRYEGYVNSTPPTWCGCTKHDIQGTWYCYFCIRSKPDKQNLNHDKI